MTAKYRHSVKFLYPASQNNGVSINAVRSAALINIDSFYRNVEG